MRVEDYKFRVWDKKTSEIRGVMGFDYETRTIRISSVPDRVFSRGGLHTIHALSRELDDVVVMQYTGIDDIHGRGIYEGDVINITTDTGPAGVSFRQFIVKRDKFGGYGWSDLSLNNIEIIGNLYEGVRE